MGCTGEIYLVYGVEVPASIVWNPGKEEGDVPIIYCINGHNVADGDDKDEIDEYKEDNPDEKVPEVALYAPWDGPGYGAADAMDDVKLSVIVLGDNVFGMGSRHFNDKALLGLVVCNECYLGSAAACPPMEEIQKQDARLIREIQEKLKLDVFPSEFRLHLYFGSLNG